TPTADPLSYCIEANDTSRGIRRDHTVSDTLQRIDCQLPLAAVGQVSRHLGEAHQRSRIVPHRPNQYVRPELAAILAQPPTLRFRAASFCGLLQQSLWLALITCFGGIETTKTRPDDLFGEVPLQRLRAPVPASDQALSIQSENRNISDGVEQQL